MSSATTALLSRFMSTLLMVAFLARSSSSSLTLLATACKPTGGDHLADVGKQHYDYAGKRNDD